MAGCERRKNCGALEGVFGGAESVQTSHQSTVTRHQLSIQRAQKISELDCLSEVVALVAVLPIDPDVFNSYPTAVFRLAEFLNDPSVINGVVLEASLQSSLERAADVEVAGGVQETFDLRIAYANACEVGVIESESQTRHCLDESLGRLGFGNDGSDVRFDGEYDPMCFRLLYSPTQLFNAP